MPTHRTFLKFPVRTKKGVKVLTGKPDVPGPYFLMLLFLTLFKNLVPGDVKDGSTFTYDTTFLIKFLFNTDGQGIISILN